MNNKHSHSYVTMDSISIKTHKNILHVTFFTEVSLMILSLCSCSLIALPVLNIVGTPAIIISIVLIPIVSTFVFSVNGKIIKPLMIIGSILFLAGLIWFNREDLINGLLYFYDSFVEQMNTHFGTSYITFSRVHTSAYKTDFINVTMTILLSSLSVIIGYIIIIAKSPLLMGLIFCPFVYMAINFSSKPPVLALVLIVLILAVILAMRVSTSKHRGEPIGKSFSKRRNTIWISDNSFRVRDAMPSCVTISAVILISISIILVFVPLSSYNPDRSMNKQLNSIITPMLKSNSFAGLFNKTSNGGIGSGRLGESDSISYRNELQLLVNSTEKKPMLLKGFIGDHYDGNTWKTDPPMNYSKDIFERFYNTQSSVHLFSSQYPKYLAESNTVKGAEPSSVYVQNVKANGNYAYLPYSYYSAPFLSSTSNNKLDLWVTPVGDNRDKYTAWYYSFANTDDNKFSNTNTGTPVSDKYTTWYYSFTNTDDNKFSNTNTGIPVSNTNISNYNNSITPEIKKLYKDYTNYVYNTYTAMPDIDKQKRGYNIAINKINTAMLKGENIAAAGRQDYSKQEIDNTVEHVRNYLFSNTQYSLSPGRASGNTDFIYKFLRDGKGYCMHYATTATIMLRSVGIPARFVEGYTITARDYAVAEQNGTDTLQIYDTNAHAWVEVFINDVGWVPYEVTPGFSGQQISNTNLEDLPDPPPPVEVASPEEEAPNDYVADDTHLENISSDVSSDSTSSENISGESSNAIPDNVEKPTAMIVVLIALLLLVLAILGIYVRRKLVWQSKNRRFNSRDLNKAVVSLFIQCECLLRLLGRKSEDFSELNSFAENVETYIGFIEPNSFKTVVKFAEKANFSNHMISQEEHNTVKQFEKMLRQKTASKLGKLKRFIYKWIIIVL